MEYAPIYDKINVLGMVDDEWDGTEKIMESEQRVIFRMKEKIMNELFVNVDKEHCVIDTLLVGKKKEKNKILPVSKESEKFIEKKHEELLKVINSGKILFFTKYEYEKILNEYLQQEYGTEKLQVNMFNKEMLKKESEQKVIWENVDKLRWKKKIYHNNITYTVTDCNEKKFKICIKTTKETNEKKYMVQYDNKFIEIDEHEIEKLIEKIEELKPILDREGCVSVIRPENIIKSNEKRKKDNIKKIRLEEEKTRKRNTENKQIIEQILADSDKYLIQLSTKYGLKYKTIIELERECQNNCKYNIKFRFCTLKNCCCMVLLPHCIKRDVFLENIRAKARNIPVQENSRIRQSRIELCNKTINKTHINPHVVENIAEGLKKKCTLQKDGKCRNSVGLQKCALFCEYCARFEKYINKIKCESKMQETNQYIERKEKKLYQIGVKDFVVRGNIIQCMHKFHEIQNVDALIKVSLNNGADKQIPISAGYCEECEVYFIMESTYQKLKSKGLILCRITDLKTYLKGGFMNGSKLAQESILMQYGYNVSQTKGLSATRRQKILAVIIDNKILSKSEIISYLDFFIRQRSSRNNMGIAISKWEEDREFVENYKIGHYTQYGVNAIYRR